MNQSLFYLRILFFCIRHWHEWLPHFFHLLLVQKMKHQLKLRIQSKHLWQTEFCFKSTNTLPFAISLGTINSFHTERLCLGGLAIPITVFTPSTSFSSGISIITLTLTWFSNRPSVLTLWPRNRMFPIVNSYFSAFRVGPSCSSFFSTWWSHSLSWCMFYPYSIYIRISSTWHIEHAHSYIICVRRCWKCLRADEIQKGKWLKAYCLNGVITRAELFSDSWICQNWEAVSSFVKTFTPASIERVLSTAVVNSLSSYRLV